MIDTIFGELCCGAWNMEIDVISRGTVRAVSGVVDASRGTPDANSIKARLTGALET